MIKGEREGVSSDTAYLDTGVLGDFGSTLEPLDLGRGDAVDLALEDALLALVGLSIGQLLGELGQHLGSKPACNTSHFSHMRTTL